MRLIDVDNFVNNLKLMLSKSRLGEISPQESISVGELATLIKYEPIAYDVDKVVEKLEQHKKEIKCRKERDILNKVANTSSKATVEKDIEIVKSGFLISD